MSGERREVYAEGSSFRARAEARQREYRCNVLKAGSGKHDHRLEPNATAAGMNFTTEEAFLAAKERQKSGKGVGDRTFENMLSSQAMCFNLFAPLQSRLDLAANVLREFIPGLATVKEITIEYTPDPTVFGDQTGRGGVDCDVLIEGKTVSGDGMVIVIETKFVEPHFSSCGFRKSGRAAKGLDVCPEDVRVCEDRARCLYVSKKRYKYWARSDELSTLKPGAPMTKGCPFGGQLWQLWVNHVLAHVEAKTRGAKQAVFAVCAPSGNNRLLKSGKVLDDFRAIIRDPNSAIFIELGELISVLDGHSSSDSEGWVTNLKKRYCAI